MIWGLVAEPAGADSWPALEARSRYDLRRVGLSRGGYFFFSTPPYLDWAEDEERLLLKFGPVRVDGEVVSAEQLLADANFRDDAEGWARLGGGGLLVLVHKRASRLSSFKTLVAVPEMYYRSSPRAIVCSNNLAALVELLDEPELDPAAIPQHLMYRSISGSRTYIQDVFRLTPGYTLGWDAGRLESRLVCDLRSIPGWGEIPVSRASAGQVHDRLVRVLEEYLARVGCDSSRLAVLLSGGVDSSILQLALNRLVSDPQDRQSLSYFVDLKSFALEKEYAEAAARHFQTQHTFIRVGPEEYSASLLDFIDTIGQPPPTEQSVCFMPFMREVAEVLPGLQLLVSGQGADTLFGMKIAKKVWRAERRIRRLSPLLSIYGRLPAPLRRSRTLEMARGGTSRLRLNETDSPLYPENSEAMFSDWDALLRCFDRSLLEGVMADRREPQARSLAAPGLVERVHALDLLTDAYDVASLRHQAGLHFDREVLFPFLDSDIVAAAYEFSAAERYFLRGETKPVLRQILRGYEAYPILNKRKLGGGFAGDLRRWMKEGVLRELVHEIERPGYMEKALFDEKLAQPDWLTWNLLTMDLLEKRLLRSRSESDQRLV